MPTRLALFVLSLVAALTTTVGGLTPAGALPSTAAMPAAVAAPAQATGQPVSISGPAAYAGRAQGTGTYDDVERDGGWPTTLADGRTLWVFGDSAHLHEAPYFFKGATAAFADPSNPSSLFDPRDAKGEPGDFLPRTCAEACDDVPGTRYTAVWPSGATTLPDGIVVISYLKYEVTVSPFSSTLLGAGLYAYTYPGYGNLGGPQQANRIADDIWTPATFRAGGHELTVGTPLYADGHVHLTACAQFGFTCYSMRATQPNLANRGAYQWWTGSGWGSEAQRQPMTIPGKHPGVSPSITWVPQLGQYAMTATELSMKSNTGHVWFADAPQGPWSSAQSFSLPGCGPSNCYSVMAHPEASTTNRLRIAYANDQPKIYTHTLDLPVTDHRQDAFTPVAPTRLADTRDGTGGIPRAPLTPGGVLNVRVAEGPGGAPSAVDAVVVNITASVPTEPGFVTAYGSGTGRPPASNLNLKPGRGADPNLAVVPVGPNGRISLYGNAGLVHVVVDIVGWYGRSGSLGYGSVSPFRVADSRDGTGWATGRFGAGAQRSVVVAGKPGVPADARAVVVNITAIAPTADSYIAAWGAGSKPGASASNPAAGVPAEPNLAVVPVDPATGRITLYNFSGSVHLAVDVLGYYAPGAAARYGAISPVRLGDTRSGWGMPGQSTTPLGSNGVVDVRVAGTFGIPADVKAVVVNLTAVSPSASSYLTAWAKGAAQPGTSNLNTVAGVTDPNLAVVPVGADGYIRIRNHVGSVHVLVDVAGWLR